VQPCLTLLLYMSLLGRSQFLLTAALFRSSPQLHFRSSARIFAGEDIRPCNSIKALLHTTPSLRYPLLHLRSDNDSNNNMSGQIDFEKSVGHTEPDQPVSWNRRDLLLYSVGIGASAKQLDYVYEQSAGFRPFPTYPIVLGLKGTSEDITVFSEMIGSRGSIPGFPKLSPNTIVHGEQSLEILHEIPAVSGEGWKLKKRVVAVHDKPTGLIVENEQQLVSPVGRTHAIMVGSAFYRGGGQNTNFSKSIIKKPQTVKVPSSAPTFTLKDKTSPNQAAIYRLSSDYNPLHIDPQIGEKGGLGGCILHGLCSYAFATRAILESVVKGDGQPGTPATELKLISARELNPKESPDLACSLPLSFLGFTSPVYPGQELETSVWHVGEKDAFVEVAFEQTIVGGKKSLGGGYALVKKGSSSAKFRL
jgi:peroxisomal enoyl-CoA hydratase 2